MNYRALIDSDVILDLLAQREPYAADAQEVFSRIDRQEVQGYVTPVIFSNLYYILRKLKSHREALRILSDLKLLLSVLPMTEKTVEKALKSDFGDFEDALQYHAAVENNLKFLITRNKRDYRTAQIAVCTAREFIELMRT